jgi:uncharacterized protein
MEIGVISDTHDQHHHIKEAVKILNEKNVELVIHCGDWVSPFILNFFRGLKAPLRGVFGNNDGDRFRHHQFKDKWGLDLQFEERFLKLEIDHRVIAVFHGDYPELVDALVRCGQYDAVFHGHTHQRVNETIGRTLSLNPGSFMDETLPGISGAGLAIYNTQTNSATHIML